MPWAGLSQCPVRLAGPLARLPLQLKIISPLIYLAFIILSGIGSLFSFMVASVDVTSIIGHDCLEMEEEEGVRMDD